MIKTTWVDPATNKEYSYGWGFDTSGDAARLPAEFYKNNKEKTTMNYEEYFKKTRDQMKKDRIKYNKITMKQGYIEFLAAIPDLSEYIEDVIHNDPATIIFWKDGTKTVVKCQEGNEYSPTVGFAMAVCKKVFGNKGRFNEVFKKWVPDYAEKANL